MSDHFHAAPNGSQNDGSADTTDPVAGKTVAEILGEIVWLMTQDPCGRDAKISEIEQLIMPAILERRFHIRYLRTRPADGKGDQLQPISVDILPRPTEENAGQAIVRYSLQGKIGAGTLSQ